MAGKFDIAVIGAGPAGSMAAGVLLLQDDGYVSGKKGECRYSGEMWRGYRGKGPAVSVKVKPNG